MKLSIIIPVYNAAPFVEECIESLINEMDLTIEILLLDDGSMDDSLKKCMNYAGSNVRVLHHDNRGVSYTRNRGIREALGDYIMFVDADDKMLLNWKTYVDQGIHSNKDIIYFSENLKGKDVKRNEIVNNIIGIRSEENYGHLASPCSKIYKREFVIKNAIMFDEDIVNGEDAIFNLRAILRTCSIGFIGSSIYQYRINNNSSSRKYNTRFFDSNLQFLQIVKEELDNSGWFSQEKIYSCISYSLTYSIYLYLFLISTIKNKTERNIALNCLDNMEIRQYIFFYDISKECNILVRFLCFLVKNRKYKIAMSAMKIVNIVRKRKRMGATWEKI